MRHARALLACLLAGCYHASNLACAVSCASDLSCPGGLQCGLSDHLCHAGPRECSGTKGTGIGSELPATPQQNHYVGLIDNLRIWSVARKQADICTAAAPKCR